MRAKITVDSRGVTVTRDDPFRGQRITTTYFAPHTVDGHAGYVRIRDSHGQYPQVCEILSGSGKTLMATPKSLPAIIRRELRKLNAAEKREMAR